MEKECPCKFGFTKALLDRIIELTSDLSGKTIQVDDIELIRATSFGFDVKLKDGDRHLLKYKV